MMNLGVWGESKEEAIFQEEVDCCHSTRRLRVPTQNFERIIIIYIIFNVNFDNDTNIN